ncbi:MAG: penicillin-binding protein 2 [Pontibacterium sp.]
MNSADFKPHSQEQRTFVARSLVAGALVFVVLALIFARYYYLQVVEHDRYAALSEDNRIQYQPVAPTRGLLFDRNGQLLADNQPTFRLTLLKEEAGNIDEALAEIGQLIELSESDIERFYKRLDQRRRPHSTVPLKFRLTDEEIALLSVNYHRLPGVSVEADLTRYYPHGETLVHALGYVGRINDSEAQRLDKDEYAATHYVGKLGVEKYFESQLHGKVGYQKVEVNARGRVMRVLESKQPEPGKNLQLTLDMDLQRASEKLLEGRRASIVAIDPKDGGILALVSTPGYDPNQFVTGISSKDYNALKDSPDLPLFNRALRGRYPPGSTIKPIVALAAIDSGTVKPSFKVRDPGWFTLTEGGRKYRDWKRTGHGTVGLNLALAQSCDTWFYNVANRMGPDPMADYLGRFGFGKDPSIGLPEATRGILPSKEWKRNVRGRSWYPGDSLNMSIGQGFMVTTPLQLATATAVIANRGKWVQPHMVTGEVVTHQDSENPALAATSELKPIDIEYAYEKPKDVELNHPEYWDIIIKGMVDVVHGPQGTARKVGLSAPYQIAGKTGTAQVVGIKQDEEYDAEALDERHRDHALFVAFAPVDDPQIAVAVIVENGGGGSSTAAPIARQVMDAYLLGVEPTIEETPLLAAVTDSNTRHHHD